jgi:hypothetical protein
MNSNHDSLGRYTGAIKYVSTNPTRNKGSKWFRMLHIDDENFTSVQTVLGLNRQLKHGTSEALCILARVHAIQNQAA